LDNIRKTLGLRCRLELMQQVLARVLTRPDDRKA
jgi:hypothetical protein